MLKGLAKEEKSWILYDWASQGYIMIIHSTILGLYFLESAAMASIDEVTANAYWGFGNTIATVIVGIMAPVIGTLSGYKGKKKLMFNFFASIGIIGTIALALVPEHLWWLLLVIFMIASIGYSGSNKIYDAFLMDVSPKENMNRVSTLGFGFGYIGGALPFILSIPLVVMAQLEVIDMPLVTAYRISFWIAAIWWIIFGVGMFKNVHQKIGVDPEPQYIRKSFIGVWTTYKEIRKYKHIWVFLIAFFLYSDGLSSIIRLATTYGRTIGLDAITLLMVLLVTQFVAFPFAIIYGKMAERIGAKKMIYFGIGTYCIICIIALTMNPARDIRFLTFMFWALAMLVGTAQGGVQALSRSYFGRIIPKEKSNEFFGFYNIFGRFASILGTTFFSVISLVTGRAHWGIAGIVVLFIAAAIVFRRVPDDRELAKED